MKRTVYVDGKEIKGEDWANIPYDVDNAIAKLCDQVADDCKSAETFYPCHIKVVVE